MLPSPQRRGQRQRQQEQQQQSPGVLHSAAAVLFGFKNKNTINSGDEHEENSSTSGPTPVYTNNEKNELRKTISILDNKSKLPDFVQKELKILIHNFLKDTKNIAQEFLCDGHLNEDIDTKQQLTTLVDYFPETLANRYRYPRYPIQAACGTLHHRNRNHNDHHNCQNRNQNNQNQVMKPVLECNVKALPFIPTLIELGKKHNNVFGDNNEMRLGILSSDRYGYNLFDYLTCDTILSSSSATTPMTNYNCNEKIIIEEKLLDMMKQLRGMNLLLREDISKYDLLFKSLSVSSSTASRSSSERFRYLVNWYPNGLKKKAVIVEEDGIDDDEDDDDGDNGDVLLHYSTMITDFQHSSSSSSSKSKSPGQNTNNKNKIQLEERIRPFQLALKAGVRHFPNEIGYLFHKNNNGITPYDLACNQYTEDVTLNIVRQICYPDRNSDGGQDDDDDDDTSHAGLDSLLGGFMKTKKMVPLKSFLLATIDNDIKIDSLYIQLCQDPNMIQKLILLVEKDNDTDNNEGVEYWDYYNDNNIEDGGGGSSGSDCDDSNTECDFVIPVLPFTSLNRLFTIVVEEWKRVSRT
ncbi:hypothetical protein FRACYDRAFT_238377 [Fragilariopsis cylindrus CCMP1102]|uniref:Uncharacterized protein n=1 Tax=Fragilariopsis cylindrus CCMP1102 TaxID=635003 RepID=A0A1E7FIE6_9STRA|nr:hypothetical protein FRACYDRAFT_238377 [Fragilariopsis cylindrus CCMP1102]|eukprot:OEU17946.1 hypothetical protein FRACYDRAFT_238377 [Fragilariopsis cylindrus CCMP1102]